MDLKILSEGGYFSKQKTLKNGIICQEIFIYKKTLLWTSESFRWPQRIGWLYYSHIWVSWGWSWNCSLSNFKISKSTPPPRRRGKSAYHKHSSEIKGLCLMKCSCHIFGIWKSPVFSYFVSLFIPGWRWLWCWLRPGHSLVQKIK